MDLMESLPIVTAFGGIPAAIGTVDPGRLKAARRRAQCTRTIRGNTTPDVLNLRWCGSCNKNLMLCSCDTDSGKDIIIHPKSLPAIPDVMLPADNLVRWDYLYNLTAGLKTERILTGKLLEHTDIVVAVLQQHTEALMDTVQGYNPPDYLDSFIQAAYGDMGIKRLLQDMFDITDADRAKRWVKTTVQAFCRCQFDKLCTLQLYAINLFIQKCDAIPLAHKRAMQEAVNYVYSANSNVFESTMLSMSDNFKSL